MCNCEKTLEANKEMFKGFDFGDTVLNYDGYICKEEYEKADKKIVFILKESYTDDIKSFQSKEQGSSITYQLCKVLSYNEDSKNYYFGKDTNSTKMFNTLGLMAKFLLSLNNKEKEFKLEDIPENHFEKQKELLEVAYLNISKEVLQRGVNESKESNPKELEEKFQKYKLVLKKQLEILNPDIIVACGKIGNEGIFSKIVEEIFNKKLEVKDLGEIEIELNNKPVKVLFSYHPAYSQSYKEFITQLKKRLNYLK